MGCHVSTAVPQNSVIRNTFSPEHVSGKSNGLSTGAFVRQLISEEEQHLVQKTWARMSLKPTHHGMSIFLKIFESKPDLKLLFPFRDVADDELRQHPYFRCHASHFMAAVGSVVENLDELDSQVTPELRLLGCQHAKMSGFGVGYFELFTRCVLSEWKEELGEDFSTEVHSAWEKLFLFVLMTLRDGYLSCKPSAELK